MSKIAVLQPTQTGGEYQVTEWQDYDSDLNDYLSECDGDIEICPEGEAPIVYNGGGVTLRIWHKYTAAEREAREKTQAGTGAIEGWYSYEQFIEDAEQTYNG